VARGGTDGAALPEAIGRFRIRELIGLGGNAVIYSAWDQDQDRQVAIKLLRDDRSSRPDTQARFMREAKSMARLAHPNVVRIYEVGMHEGRAFLALEYVQGQTLREWLEAERPELDEIIGRYLEAGRGLLAAHEAGVMHRDFKPDNAVLGDDGHVRVVDFGLARSTRGTDNFKTIENQTPGLSDALAEGPELISTIGLSGTPAYMSLEQHFGRSADPRADQFSFCVALWEALFGERPFDGRTAGQIARAIEAGQIRQPTGPRATAVPRRLRKALERGLSGERVDRWPSIAELLGEIEAARASMADKPGLLGRLLGFLTPTSTR
jgi:serine/threonine protein kinase